MFANFERRKGNVLPAWGKKIAFVKETAFSVLFHFIMLRNKVFPSHNQSLYSESSFEKKGQVLKSEVYLYKVLTKR